MCKTLKHGLWLLVGLLGLAAVLYAQEPATQGRGLIVERGNIVVSAGGIRTGTDSILAGGVGRDTRTVTAITTAGNVTYTAAQILTGIITRGSLGAAARTDALPTAANLVAALPADQQRAGFSFLLAVEMTATAEEAMTLNGSSTGVTYGSVCGTSIQTNEAMLVIVTVTTATSGSEAVRATCVVGETA